MHNFKNSPLKNKPESPELLECINKPTLAYTQSVSNW